MYDREVDVCLQRLDRSLQNLANGFPRLNLTGKVYRVPAPGRPFDGSLQIEERSHYEVIESTDIAGETLFAWSCTQRLKGQHARYSERWPGCVIGDPERMDLIDEVNRAKAELQAKINSLLPATKMDGAGRVARSRAIAALLPKGTDRRYLYRAIPVVRPGRGSVRYAYINWRRNTASVTRVDLGHIIKALEKFPVPEGVSPEDAHRLAGSIANGALSLVREGYQLVHRVPKPPHAVVNFRGSKGVHVTTIPSSLPVFLGRDCLEDPAFDSDSVIHSSFQELDLGTPRGRDRSDMREYIPIGFQHYFAVWPTESNRE